MRTILIFLFLADAITTVSFDPTGEFLSLGYQCGQVVIFKNQVESDSFKIHTQFESHASEFDSLTSLDIKENINKISWVKNKYVGNSRLMLSTNGNYLILVNF